MASISVVIPTCNHESTIGVSLDSLLAQSHRDWEAIIIDEGSSDGTYTTIMGYAERDRRIRVELQANAGVSAARNRGLALAPRPWMFFLDAGDWISSDAFSLLSRALARHPHAVAARGGCIRVLADGTEVRERQPPSSDELFLTFARTCAFPIHTCLVKTDLVRAVGGFDESLVTCEDWDLWQRVARTRPLFATIPEYIAYYRFRRASASGNADQLLRDGLRVIERGHGHDPRLAAWPGTLHRGQRPELASSARLYLTADVAGLCLASGGDARELLPLVPDGAPGDVDGATVAETLFHAIVVARATVPAAWPSFPSELQANLDAFVDAMGAKVHANWLSFATTDALARLIVEHTDADATLMIGSTQLSPVTVGAPVEHIELRPGARRVLLDVRAAEEKLGTAVVPAVDGVVPWPVAADAIVDELAWDLLERFFARTVYPQLTVTRTEHHLTVHRGRVLLADVEIAEDKADADSIHDLVGWTVFLQELWGLRDWKWPRFYRGGRRVLRERARRALNASPATLVVEVSEDLPKIVGARGPLDVQVTLAGVPFMVVRIHPSRGRVGPGALRRAITYAGRYELCRIATREALLAGPWPDEVPLRTRLRAAAHRRRRDDMPSEFPPGSPAGSDLWRPLLEEAVPAGRRAVIVGRRASGPLVGAVSRTVSFPVAAADVMLDAARAAGQPVFEFGDAAQPDMALYAPFVIDPARVVIEQGDPSPHDLAEQFDHLFSRSPDPWDYTSAYERHKYDDTLSLVPAHVTSALEVGCAEGVFTERLAARAERLTAADISRVALERAQRRCVGSDNVDFRQLDVFSEPLPGDNELIVCSETLYYARDEAQLKLAVRALATALKPGGVLVTTHAMVLIDDPSSAGFDWDEPFGAAGIERTLLADGRLVLREEIRAPMYRAQRYERVAGRRWPPAARRPQSVARRASVDVPDLTPEVAAHFHAHGRSPRTGDDGSGPTATRLPILMYHRVCDDPNRRARRWSVTPAELEEQLAFLRENDFYSLAIEEWAAAGSENRAVPGHPVILTFDDGYVDFAEHAVPLLERYGFRAEVFVVTGLAGATNAWEIEWSGRDPLMDWSTLTALPEHTVRIGSHTHSHRRLVALSSADALRELVNSRATLEDHLGRRVSSLAYPYGAADEAIQRLAGAAGYDFAYTTHEWWAYLARNLLKLPRLEVQRGQSIADFALMMNTPF